MSSYHLPAGNKVVFTYKRHSHISIHEEKDFYLLVLASVHPPMCVFINFFLQELFPIEHKPLCYG